MTKLELAHTMASWLNHPLYQRVRRELRRMNPLTLLDVGGRKSPYTIGLPAVWITDVPREHAIQHELNLGATDAIRHAVLSRRSNVRDYVYDDMTQTKLAAGTFDVVNATEVLEHVEEDERFVENAARVLKAGGYFVMSTPNGDWKPVPYPDHKRHYKAADLTNLLRRHFTDVRVDYCVNAGVLHKIGNRWPFLGTWAYALSTLLERLGIGGAGPDRKHHLFAVCRK
jgi:SAM-dependent methyltransferase